MDQRLVEEWKRRLPERLNSSDSVEVHADDGIPNALLIHMDVAGRSKYSFDFRCTYMDSREVKVDLLDVEQDGIHVDEHTEPIQNLAEDYVRHIHECAQDLQDVTTQIYQG
ncbi:hypothetical protein [Ferviditalea candida]|uniref:Uncharacterized protein n=1 Tax=Ferviditalea candida TaxID=3108399 RepID=A0ABU5ZQL6_9BACL|nr:hypothetical protein [Paenibacillaceae bacterium T2]